MKPIRIVITLLMVLMPAGQALAAAKQIAIVPFKVNADKDVSYLRDGIYDMLSSRLYKEGEVEVIPRPQVEKVIASVSGGFSEAKARDIGKLMGADFLLFGSLTVLGNSISVDSKMVDVSGAKATLNFFEQSEDAGGIVTRVNQMAAEINDKIFGRAPAARAAAPAPAPQASTSPFDSTTAHPEKLFKQGGAGTDDVRSPFATDERAGRELSPKFWRSTTFNQVFNGIALGDVDRDGKLETVVITPKSVLIYRFDQGRFFKVHEIESSGLNIGVDVADINGNGTPEIFVTSLTPTRKALASFVLEWDGKAFQRIVDNANWFFRVSDSPDRGRVLLGQQYRTEAPFQSRIEEMRWRGGQYESDTEILPSYRNVNVLGVTLSGIVEGQKETVVAFDRLDHIKVFDAAGKELWKSAEQYGGTTLNSLGHKESAGDMDPVIYFNMRLLPLQDKDGKPKLLVVKNFDVAGLKLETFRSFDDSQIMSFYWDGHGLSQEWRTRKLSGCIRDFAVGDFDNDGVTELVTAVVIDEARIIGATPKCAVIAFKFAN